VQPSLRVLLSGVVLAGCAAPAAPPGPPPVVAGLDEIRGGLGHIVATIGDVCEPGSAPSHRKLRTVAGSAIGLVNDAADFGAASTDGAARALVAEAGDLASRTSALAHGDGKPARICRALRGVATDARNLLGRLGETGGEA
jgi:hypothetical protein